MRELGTMAARESHSHVYHLPREGVQQRGGRMAVGAAARTVKGRPARQAQGRAMSTKERRKERNSE